MAALTGVALACIGACACAGQPDPSLANAEFIEFLEYLGSWEGSEEDWVQFLPALEQASTVDAATVAPDYKVDSTSL
jgi:hypothetical protein